MPGYARHTKTRELVAIREQSGKDGPELVMIRYDGTKGIFPGAWRMVIAADLKSASAAQIAEMADIPRKDIHGSTKDPKLPKLRKLAKKGRLMKAELTIAATPDRVKT